VIIARHAVLVIQVDLVIYPWSAIAEKLPPIMIMVLFGDNEGRRESEEKCKSGNDRDHLHFLSVKMGFLGYDKNMGRNLKG
jgi:hypothetical protein